VSVSSWVKKWGMAVSNIIIVRRDHGEEFEMHPSKHSLMKMVLNIISLVQELHSKMELLKEKIELCKKWLEQC